MNSTRFLARARVRNHSWWAAGTVAACTLTAAHGQDMCFHLGQPVICPHGITAGSTSVSFTPTGILWSDGNTSVGFNPAPFVSNMNGGPGAPGQMPGGGFTSTTQQIANTTDLEHRPGDTHAQPTGLAPWQEARIADALFLFAAGDWMEAADIGSGAADERYERQRMDEWQRFRAFTSQITNDAVQRRSSTPGTSPAPGGGVSSTAGGDAPTTVVDDALVNDLIDKHLPGAAGDKARELLQGLKPQPAPTYEEPASPTTTSSTTAITPSYDDSISFLESRARFREQMAEHERDDAQRHREWADQERDYAEQYRELARNARRYADEASNDKTRQDWLDRANEHEQTAQRFDESASGYDDRATQDDARAEAEDRAAQEARDLEVQQQQEAEARYQAYLAREAEREAAIQQRLADLAAAEEAARLAAQPKPGTKENPIKIDLADPNGSWAREVARMEQEIEDRAKGDIYAGFYDPRIPAALDSEYLGKQDQYFEFNGRIMNGGELNYYFQGMYWAKAGLPEIGMDALIYGWKAVKYATDENYKTLAPSANDIAAAEAGHDDFW